MSEHKKQLTESPRRFFKKSRLKALLLGLASVVCATVGFAANALGVFQFVSTDAALEQASRVQMSIPAPSIKMGQVEVVVNNSSSNPINRVTIVSPIPQRQVII